MAVRETHLHAQDLQQNELRRPSCSGVGLGHSARRSSAPSSALASASASVPFIATKWAEQVQVHAF